MYTFVCAKNVYKIIFAFYQSFIDKKIFYKNAKNENAQMYTKMCIFSKLKKSEKSKNKKYT